MKNVKNRSKFHEKWPFFAIILPWMASYGSERRFVLIFSARDDFGKVSWKMDARKCQNQGTPLSLTTSVKVANPFPEAGSSARCRRPVVGRCPLRPLTITLPSCASPPHSGTASFAFFPISDPPHMAIVPKLSLPRIFFQIWHIFYRHFQGKQPPKYFPWDVPFYFNHQRDNAKTLT